jgi:hypothetical protein
MVKMNCRHWVEQARKKRKERSEEVSKNDLQKRRLFSFFCLGNQLWIRIIQGIFFFGRYLLELHYCCSDYVQGSADFN